MTDDDDYTMGDLFNGLRKRSQDKRASNRANGAAELTARNVRYTSHDGGVHLIVEHDGATVDYWPGTGLWICRINKQRGRGIRPLLKHLGVSR